MNFFKRASIFFVLFGLILIFIGYTVTSFTSSSSEKDRRYSKNRKGAEREYTVFTDQVLVEFSKKTFICVKDPKGCSCLSLFLFNSR